MAKRAAMKFYLAYGSNMNLPQMERRCPKAVKMFPVTLPGYRLAFRGRSRDGNGVGTVIPDESSSVPCLLWAITPWCEEALDIYEGYPTLYKKETVKVIAPSGKEIEAMVYIMTEQYNKPAAPSIGYFRSILEGYEANGISPKALYDALAKNHKELHPRKKKKAAAEQPPILDPTYTIEEDEASGE